MLRPALTLAVLACLSACTGNGSNTGCLTSTPPLSLGIQECPPSTDADACFAVNPAPI